LRIELIMTVLAGCAGGLAGTLWSGTVSAPLLANRPQLRAAGWTPDTGWRVLQTAAVYGCGGAAAGLLFWLGWGLAAFTAVPWFVVGAAYGGLLWLAAALPSLLLLAVRVPKLRAAALIMAVEALVTTAAIGLLCAYVWHHAT
jgi:hypothetical protein